MNKPKLGNKNDYNNNQETPCMSLSIFRTLQENNIEYVYIGQFTNKITDSILSLAELNLQLINESLKVRKRVYFILVEGLQNITRHQSISPKHVDKSGVLIIQRIKDQYIITTANYVKKDEIENLKQHIDSINSLDDKELKDYYREVLQKQKISHKGGAGLGLIEIARKSNNKLLYEFQPADKKHYVFFLQTQISPAKNTENQTNKENLENIKKVYSKLIKCNILFSISGIFNQDKIIYMLSLLEKRLQSQTASKNKIFNIIVELVQNIVNHADDSIPHNSEGHHGVFYIAEQGNNLIITTGNYIKNEKINKVKDLLNKINSLSIKELNEKHRDILKSFKNNQKYEQAGLGLINLRLKSRDKINFYFEKVDDKFSFFSIEVKLKKGGYPKLKPLHIKATDNTPAVILTPTKSVFIFRGACMPCDARSFFAPIHKWIDTYSNAPLNYTPITFDLNIINTPCKKEITQLFEKINKLNDNSIITVKWKHNNNEDVKEFGENLAKIFPHIKMEIIPE